MPHVISPKKIQDFATGRSQKQALFSYQIQKLSQEEFNAEHQNEKFLAKCSYRKDLRKSPNQYQLINSSDSLWQF